MASDLDIKIIKQIEYYFGDVNLPRDKFLQEKVKEDEGWISLEVLLSFNRLSNLSTDEAVIADAVKKSTNNIVEVSEDCKKIRRSPHNPLPELNEERKKELDARTAYAKGFPFDDNLDNILKFLEPHGVVESCQLRTYLDKKEKNKEKAHKFKGSIFVLFKDLDDCKKFIEAESIKCNDKELIRKWKNNYFEEKVEERNNRKNKNKPANDNKDNKTEEKLEIKRGPPGSILHFAGVEADKNLTREIIKEKMQDICKSDIQFIDYSKGLPEGYVRFTEENAAVEVDKKSEEGKIKLGDVEVTVKVLEGDEETEYYKRAAIEIKERRQRKRFPQKHHGKKRKGHFVNDGPRTKKATA